MRRGQAVCGADRPLVLFHIDAACAEVQHRFDAEHHPGREDRTFARADEIGDLRRFVKPRAAAVPDEIADDAELVLFRDFRDGARDVADVSAGVRCRDARFERFLRSGEEKPQIHTRAPGRVRHSDSMSMIFSRVRNGSISVK